MIDASDKLARLGQNVIDSGRTVSVDKHHPQARDTNASLSVGISGGSSSAKKGRRAKRPRVDVKAKLEKSRQSARECRARKKLRYQYLEDLVIKREQAVQSLWDEYKNVSIPLPLLFYIQLNNKGYQGAI